MGTDLGKSFNHTIHQQITVTVPRGHVSMVRFIYHPLPQLGYRVLVYKGGKKDKDVWGGFMHGVRRPADLKIVPDCAEFLVVHSRDEVTIPNGFKLLFTFHKVKRPSDYHRLLPWLPNAPSACSLWSEVSQRSSNRQSAGQGRIWVDDFTRCCPRTVAADRTRFLTQSQSLD